MITYTPATNYNNILYEVITRSEGIDYTPYYDSGSNNAPTIGVGFNLRDAVVRDYVLHGIGFANLLDSNIDPQLHIIESYWQQQITKALVRTDLTNADLVTELDSIMALRSQDNRYQVFPNVELRGFFGFSSSLTGQTDQLGLIEMQSVLNQVLSDKEQIINTWLTAVGVDPVLTIGSQERAALVSLAYNSKYKYNSVVKFSLPSLLGPKLTTALQQSNRAEAWFEIRYNSNNEPASIQQGIAKRRYLESELFGLHNDDVTDASITDLQAKEVYRMFTEQRAHILDYEVKFGEGAGRNMRQVADSEFSTPTGILVLSLQDSFQLAYDYLILTYVAPHVTDATQDPDYRDIQVAAEGGGKLDVKVRDGFKLGSGVEQNDLMIGSTAEDVLTSGGGNDLVYGEAGHDVIDTGIGNDFVFGGAGMDDIKGGLGNDTIEGGLDADFIFDEGGDDTYIYKTGDGLDTITDKDGIGTVIYDGVTLIGGARKISIDADYGHKYQDGNRYFSTDGLSTYRYIEGALIVNDTLIVKDFKSGDLGITLDDNKNALGLNLNIADDMSQSISGYADMVDATFRPLEGTNRPDELYGLDGDDDIEDYVDSDFLYVGIVGKQDIKNIIKEAA